MMALQDSLQCFSQIQADLPECLERLNALVSAVTARYNEWVKESHNYNEGPLVRQKSSTDSANSVKPQLEMMHTPTSPEPESNQAVVPGINEVDVDPNSRQLFKEIREQRKKRKDPSLKDGASGPPRIRARTKISISYDSSLQKDFEMLVRSISSARNLLRKGKTAASFKTRFSGLKDEENTYGTDPTPYRYQTRNVPRLSQPGSSYLTGLKTGLEIYDCADKELENAQTLCEIGAHQLLRDGDCFNELRTTKTKLENCMNMLAVEIKTLEEQRELETEDGPSPSHPTVNYRAPPRQKPSLSSLDPEGVAIDGPLEADDESDHESIEIDILKLPGRRHYSSRHLMMKKSVAEIRKAVHASPPLEESDSMRPITATREMTAKPCTDDKDETHTLLADSTELKTAIEAGISNESSLVVDTARGSTGPENSLSASKGISPGPELLYTATTNDHAATVNPDVDPSVTIETTSAHGSSASHIQSAIPKTSCIIPASSTASGASPQTTGPPSFDVGDLLVADDATANESNTSEEEPVLDLAAMRACIKPRTNRPLVRAAQEDETQNAEAIIKRIRDSKLKYRRSSELIGNHDPDGNDIPDVPEFEIDTQMVVEKEDWQDSSISPNMADILRKIPKSQKA